MFVFQSICICNRASYLVPETAPPAYNKLTTLRHLMGNKKSLADTRLLLGGCLEYETPTQSLDRIKGKLVLTCFMVGVLRDSDTSHKPTNKY